MDMLPIQQKHIIRRNMKLHLLPVQQLARHPHQLLSVDGRNEHTPVKLTTLERAPTLRWVGNNRAEEHTRVASLNKHMRPVTHREDINKVRPRQHRPLE